MLKQLRQKIFFIVAVVVGFTYVALIIHTLNITLFFIQLSKKDELVLRTMSGLKMALSYLRMDIQPYPDVEVLLMLAITQANLNVANESKSQQNAINDIDLLRGLAKSGFDEGFDFLELNQPDYRQEFGDVINAEVWIAKNLSWKSLPSKPQDVSLEYYTEKCLAKIKTCGSTDLHRCWKYLSRSKQNVTAYKAITTQKRCHKENKSFLLMLENMCVDVYQQFQLLQKSGIPENYREQYCEQVFGCSIMGYYQFMTKKNLELILSWQESNGCYAKQFQENFCFLRYTAMCGGALSQFVRFLTKDEDLPHFFKQT